MTVLFGLVSVLSSHPQFLELGLGIPHSFFECQFAEYVTPLERPAFGLKLDERATGDYCIISRRLSSPRAAKKKRFVDICFSVRFSKRIFRPARYSGENRAGAYARSLCVSTIERLTRRPASLITRYTQKRRGSSGFTRWRLNNGRTASAP